MHAGDLAPSAGSSPRSSSLRWARGTLGSRRPSAYYFHLVPFIAGFAMLAALLLLFLATSFHVVVPGYRTRPVRRPRSHLSSQAAESACGSSEQCRRRPETRSKAGRKELVPAARSSKLHGRVVVFALVFVAASYMFDFILRY